MMPLLWTLVFASWLGTGEGLKEQNMDSGVSCELLTCNTSSTGGMDELQVKGRAEYSRNGNIYQTPWLPDFQLNPQYTADPWTRQGLKVSILSAVEKSTYYWVGPPYWWFLRIHGSSVSKVLHQRIEPTLNHRLLLYLLLEKHLCISRLWHFKAVLFKVDSNPIAACTSPPQLPLRATTGAVAPKMAETIAMNVSAVTKPCTQ